MGIPEMEEFQQVPEPMLRVVNPAFTELVEERGTKLCLSAEPHTHSPSAAAPCEVHRSEARQELFRQYLGQQTSILPEFDAAQNSRTVGG